MKTSELKETKKRRGEGSGSNALVMCELSNDPIDTIQYTVEEARLAAEKNNMDIYHKHLILFLCDEISALKKSTKEFEEFWRNYSGVVEKIQNEMEDEKDEILSRMQNIFAT